MITISKAISILVQKINFIYDWCLSIDEHLKHLSKKPLLLDKEDGCHMNYPILSTKYGIVPMIVGVLTGKSLDEATNPLSNSTLSYCDILHKDGSLYIFMHKTKVINRSTYNLGNFHKLILKNGSYFLEEIPIRIIVDIEYEYYITNNKVDKNSIFIDGYYYNITTSHINKSSGFKDPSQDKSVLALFSLENEFNNLLIDNVELFSILPKHIKEKAHLTNYLIIYPHSSISFDGVIDLTIPSVPINDSNINSGDNYLLCSFSELKSISVEYGKVDGSALTSRLDYISDLTLDSFHTFQKTKVITYYDKFSVNKLLSYGFDVDLSPEQLLIYCFDYSNYADNIFPQGNNLIVTFKVKDIDYRVDITYHKEFLDIMVNRIMSYLSKDKSNYGNELNKKLIALWKRYY